MIPVLNCVVRFHDPDSVFADSNINAFIILHTPIACVKSILTIRITEPRDSSQGEIVTKLLREEKQIHAWRTSHINLGMLLLSSLSHLFGITDIIFPNQFCS